MLANGSVLGIMNTDKEPSANIFNELLSSEVVNKNYPCQFYSKDLLFSVKARYEWVEPDLKSINS